VDFKQAMKILHVVGARPNFMKTAPIMMAMARRPEIFCQVLVHTGQHYDDNMSGVFFGDLGLPQPDEFLGVGEGSHAQQTARIMQAFEPVLERHRPDWVIVVGDVNSTLACALVASKLGVKVAHVEAGLRSRDRFMPEEINRLLTDQLADLLFTPSPDADDNLLKEGIPEVRIRRVGNVMIDSLVRLLPLAALRPTVRDLSLEPGRFVLATLHRPANVDSPNVLREILRALLQVGDRWPVVFPVHPRTRKTLAALELLQDQSRLRLLEPLGYLDFLALMQAARLVVTDSGGVQEETTYLGVPCLTVRPNTERPVTVELGTNRLVPARCEAITRAVAETTARPRGPRRVPPLWDGAAAERIVDVLAAF
jgi:UDP-N-acetylglucosamine 2-epimerase (non-hydrolysing)